MEWLSTVIETVERIIVYNLKATDVIEIFFIAFLLYEIIKWVRMTRAWQLMQGVILIVAVVVIAYAFNMTTIQWIWQNVAQVAAIAIVVILQPELRRALEEIGKRNRIGSVIPFDSGRKANEAFGERTISEISKACVEMSRVKTGALIVIENRDSLADYERTGIDVDGLVTSQLLINIFEKNTPLHDGAVIVQGNRVLSATCYLPLSDNMNLDKDLGTRHRAGVGISEVTDSMTVIVSEETGNISVAYEGQLDIMEDSDHLKDRLRLLRETDREEEKGRHKWKAKGKAKE